MYIGKVMTIPMLWGFARKNLLQTLVISTAAVVIYHVACMKFIAIPFLPIASIGTAVAFYVGFKNNQAYDRLWEARRLWGGITNTSRAMTALFLSLIDDKDLQKEFIFKHIAYINMLRIQLRKTIDWATSKENIHQASITEAEEIQSFEKAMLELFQRFGKADLYEKMMKLSNPASHVLRYQMAVITKLKRDHLIDDYEHSDLCKHINELYTLQGGCERIKTTPLFRQYSIFSRIFVGIFNVLLPFG
ncbi:MAG TPA: bestrophin family ion channel, partial [Chitinophagaceae bacterium]|nr:bestrophin family ion channel [Chitinophagaceae bacterium]